MSRFIFDMLNVIVLSFVMLNVVMPSNIMLSVILLSVILLSVVAPIFAKIRPKKFYCIGFRCYGGSPDILISSQGPIL